MCIGLAKADEEVAWTTSLAAAGGAFDFWDHGGVD